MLFLKDIDVPGHERVVRITDGDVGMDGFIAVHSTALGPGLGGLRIRDYPNTDSALRDVLNLSEAMTYKSAASLLPFGGGKAVIMGDPATVKNPALLSQYGRAVDELNGVYITAEDVGTTVPDLARVAEVTRWVAGLPSDQGGSGDPSPATARGVIMAMRAVADHIWGSDALEGRRVLVQGLGKVGTALVRLLCKEDAEVLVADINTERVEMVRESCDEVVPVSADVCTTEQVDIFAPCALGGVLSPESVNGLQCEAIVGSANNQLSSPDVSRALAQREIVYAPDFIANAGGIINIASEYGYTAADVEAALERIGDTVRRVLSLAEKRSVSTHEAAMEVARERLEAASNA